MNILISNDDGVYAPGLAVLADVLMAAGHQCTVIAPDRNRSGASNSLTLDRPLEAIKHSSGFYGINGTPTDCVHLGVSGAFSDSVVPDIVVSGINAGANLGDDVIYSGTVAAAMEGRHLRLPAIAVSCCDFHPSHYQTSARVVADLLEKIELLNVAPRTVLNVNVPDVPYEDLKGLEVTRLGHRYAGEPPLSVLDPRGRERFWIAAAGPAADAGAGTDFHAVANHYVSLTPLQIDMTQHPALERVRGWLETEQGE
ncbi:MAG TPA: 5'/3'-nucleotidase SurE [Marinobacterium sp.]|nr:5'/3'-nucleotidase SurE [Marinobacterium sp.]